MATCSPSVVVSSLARQARGGGGRPLRRGVRRAGSGSGGGLGNPGCGDGRSFPGSALRHTRAGDGIARFGVGAPLENPGSRLAGWKWRFGGLAPLASMLWGGTLGQFGNDPAG